MTERGPAELSKARKKSDYLLRRAEGALLSSSAAAAEGSHLRPEEALASADKLAAEFPSLGIAPRLSLLKEAAGGSARRGEYIERHGCAGVRRFGIAGGARIYLLPVETFPRHINNVYLILEPGRSTLFDVGSGFDSSRRDLALGFAVVRDIYQEDARFEAVSEAVISHAHIDHFGGVGDFRAAAGGSLSVHELDYRVIACFEERVVIALKDIEVFLCRAGVSPDERDRLLALYLASRDAFKSVPVDRTLRDGDRVGGGHRVIHTPGHCPGQICLAVGDVLLTSDHVLARITPHQFPQAITPYVGLENYFNSLAKVRDMEGVRLALGGHEEPIPDLPSRVDAIIAFHRERLAAVKAACAEPRTVVEVARALFGAQEGYGVILAIEEAGAHVEYLHERGQLRIVNVEEIAVARDPVFRYQSH
ncbi:MAG TPA: MBL fold metallo-hydrolase [Polyangiaceae bacterium]|nr:MBL fold metallo-hydrolase [Polyangiaceae bacterium]